MNEKPTYTYEAAFGGKQKVGLMISAYTMNDNIYIGLKGIEPDGSRSHYADLTVNIPSAPALGPFRAAIDIEHLGQLDAMNFLTENGLAAHAGEHLPSGYMVFPVYEFDPEKLAEADPKGFKDYLKIVGLDERQIEENSVEDLAGMAKARFLEKAADEREVPLDAASPRDPFDLLLDDLDEDADIADSAAARLDSAMLDIEAFMQYCVENGLDPHGNGPSDEGQEPQSGNGSPTGFYEQLQEIMRDEEGPLDDEDFARPPINEVDLPDTGKPFLDYYTGYGETEKVNLELGTYDFGGGLYVGLSFYDPELEGMDFYGDVTVNILPLDPFVACVDTNNNNAEKITVFLTENGIAEPTGRALPSGFCMYPVFKFNPDKLAELDPKGFEQHCKDAGIKFELKARETAASERESLDDLKNQAKERADGKNAERSEQPKPDKPRDMEL